MSDDEASVLSVVIPTQNRWEVLAPTIDALRAQTTTDFEVVVVVDRPPTLPDFLTGVRVVERQRRGVSAARNAGLAAAQGRIVLFLGDDTIPAPDLVARHVTAHERNPQTEVGVLGSVRWHPDVAAGRIQRWLDWSGTQFEYHTITGEEAGWGRLYSSNVSLKRELLRAVGGFDEEFLFGYEDTDLGLRLNEKGLRLLYEPQATVSHLHRYSWPAVERRFLLVGGSEYLMIRKHPDFPPHFLRRLTDHRRVSPASVWPWVVDFVPTSPRWLRHVAELRADAWYSKRLAPSFAAGWLAAEELDELGQLDADGRYEHVAAERLIEQRWLGDLLPQVRRAGRLLVAGCSPTMGVALAASGYRLTFIAEEPSEQEVLTRRLERRRLTASVVAVSQLEGIESSDGFDAGLLFGHDRFPAAATFLTVADSTCALVAVASRPGDLAVREQVRRGRLVVDRRYPDGSRLRVYRGKGRLRRSESEGDQRLSARVKNYAGRWLGRRPWVPPGLSDALLEARSTPGA